MPWSVDHCIDSQGALLCVAQSCSIPGLIETFTLDAMLSRLSQTSGERAIMECKMISRT